MTKAEKVKEILKRLYRIYPHPQIALQFENPLQLLVATILSAQATDKVVNTITVALFKKYKTAKDFAQADIKKLDKDILKINFHYNKAKSIIGAAKMILERFNGRVPENMEDLDLLPGVARKTANVLLGFAFHKNAGIVVDTHVIRLSKKLGLTENQDPVKIEKDLMKIVPEKNWIDFPLLLINHGRDICTAREHNCHNCPLGEICPDKK